MILDGDATGHLRQWMKNQSPSSARRNPYNQAYAGGGTITHENDSVFNYYFGTGGGDNSPYQGFTSSFTVGVGETAMICLTRDASNVSFVVTIDISLILRLKFSNK